jgi:glycine hydroxymethyltransferase
MEVFQLGEEIIDKLRETLTDHETWRRRCLNLIPSENVTSPLVRRMLASDFGHRYYWDEPWYGGQKFTEQVELLTVEAAKQLFGAKYANVRALSGHMSLMAILMGLLEPGDGVVISSTQNGGYPLNLQARFPMDIHYFPYQQNPYSMDEAAAVELVEKVKPRLVILGASLFPFPHPVREVAKAALSVGAVPVYDGSHVLGLIAGRQFQDPFGEGAEILLGSTHKTLFGPQGGIVLVRDNMELAEQIDLTLRAPPVLVDNFHMNRVAGLGVALAELLSFGEDYARQVVLNAQTLAKSLHEGGVRVVGAERGFTESHQVLLHIESSDEGVRIRDLLEAADIIADVGVRFGSQELTRLGMKEPEMMEVAELVCALLVNKESPKQVKPRVHKLIDQFQEIHYCF